MNFASRYLETIAERGQVCVGIDPHPALLNAWGLPNCVSGLREFSLGIVAEIGARATALKPQTAFFERFGSGGIAVLEETIAAGKAAGALVIVDAKRGDIGSTMTAYADAYLGTNSSLAGDAVTLSPFLGFDSLQPAITLASESDKGVFVLALTSNPHGASVQHAVIDATSVAGQMVAAASEVNSQQTPLGHVGIVIGATVGEAVHDLGIDLTSLNGPILVPGVGAQGGTMADVAAVLGPAAPYALINISRAISQDGRGGLRRLHASATKDVRCS